MIEAAEWLDAAASLLGPPHEATGQARLRRAVSTAYYAVFNAVLTKAADQLVGPDRRGTAAYWLVYRSFNHGQMKKVCKGIGARTLSDGVARALQGSTVAQPWRDFAELFVGLQNWRHEADYDLSVTVDRSRAERAIELATYAIKLLEMVTGEEPSPVLLMMALGSRE